MGRSNRVLAGTVLAWAILSAGTPRAQATCCPMPCDGCWIAWQTQLNLVVMDRAAGEVRLVPNIQFVGVSPDFALVVPTPTLPDFELAPAALWTEALAATRPVSARSQGGCGGQTAVFGSGAIGEPASDLGVIVHSERTVGAMHATVISSDDPEALVGWLQEHDFAVQDTDAARFAPYVARAWFFTAMRPDTTDPANIMPPNGWNNSVDPVVVRYAAITFEVPLPILAINRSGSTPILFWVVDDHRTTLEGFRTDYANRVQSREHASMQRTYPALAAFVASGRYLTRMQRTFQQPEEMQASLFLERAPNDAEFRRTSFAALSGGAPWIVLVAALAWRRRRKSARSRI